MTKDNNVQGVIEFLGYHVRNIMFEITDEYLHDNNPIEASLRFGHFDEVINNDILIVGLGVKIFEDAAENNYPFTMEVVLEGEFKTASESEIDIRDFIPNAVSILFPYLRSTVTNVTSTPNVTPLILPTINRNAYLDESNK